MALSTADIQAVYSLLSNALSTDDSIRKPAELSLSQCESRPGFCSCLFEIIAARDLVSQGEIRLMASVYFKNSVTRYWRKRRDSLCIGNDEKIHLRNKLMSHNREENPKIALLLAVLVSKIARTDYPKEWPDLFSNLAQQIQSTDNLAAHRGFMILLRTLKELESKRLNSDQRIFSEIASQLFDYCWKHWQSDVQSILQNFSALSQCSTANSLSGQMDDFFLVCERWFMCTKIIRHLVISGHRSDVLDGVEVVCPVKEVCPVILNAVQMFLPYYSSFPEGQPKLWEFVKKVSTKLMKILVAVQARHPYSFGDKDILGPMTDFCLNKIVNPDPAILSFRSFLIQCMIMVKSTLECKVYKPSSTGRVIGNSLTLEQRKTNISNNISELLSTMFSSERVILVCNVLIRRYFIYTTEDLDEWNQNPEYFHHEQDMVQWDENLRPCAEALYIVLFEKFVHLLSPVIISILRDAMTNCPPFETEITHRMLLKDAAYTAAGHVYYELSNYLHFDEWFNNTLVLELSNHHPNMRIIHRKIALLLGQWVSEIKNDTRRLVYSALVGLLQHHDIAVKLAACRSLCFLVQDCNFSENDFHDLLLTCCTSCFKLVEDVEEFDSKVQILNFISVLIEHAAEKIIPFANQLTIFFQKIWEESCGESLLQIQLLAALRNFVCSLGSQSSICYNMLLPILRKGVDINSPDELNLLEDSVLLWETTLSNAPSLVNQLLEIFPYLLSIMERSLDHLEVAINIIEDYIISGGTEFLNRHASLLVKLLDYIIGNVNDKGLVSILPIIDILIQLYPMEVPPLISGILQRLFVICFGRADNDNQTKIALRAASGAILARLLIMNTNYLAQLSSEPSLNLALQQEGLNTTQNILLCLVDFWLDKIDSVTTMQSKAYALALSIILTLRLPEVIDKVDEILSACTSIILGAEDQNEETSLDSSSSISSCNENFEYDSVPSKVLRQKQIRTQDPIKRLSLENMLRENLQACAALHGDASFNAVINSIHPSALAQLKQALNMP